MKPWRTILFSIQLKNNGGREVPFRNRINSGLIRVAGITIIPAYLYGYAYLGDHLQ